MTATIILTVLLFSLVARDVAAREWRGCSAAIQIVAEGKLSTLWQFDGRGSCRSRAYANDCRRAARDAIAHCVRAAWRDRWSRKLPGECATGTESSNRPHVKGIMNTDFGRGPGAIGDQDFKWAVERNACCFLHPSGGQIQVMIGANTSGDTGCSSPAMFPEGSFDLPLEPKYEVDCARVRAEGYCAVRTNGR